MQDNAECTIVLASVRYRIVFAFIECVSVCLISDYPFTLSFNTTSFISKALIFSHLSFDWLGWVQAPARHVRQEAGPAQGGGQDVQGKVLLIWNFHNSILSLFTY